MEEGRAQGDIGSNGVATLTPESGTCEEERKRLRETHTNNKM